MLVVFSHIFAVETRIVFGYNYGAPFFWNTLKQRHTIWLFEKNSNYSTAVAYIRKAIFYDLLLLYIFIAYIK